MFMCKCHQSWRDIFLTRKRAKFPRTFPANYSEKSILCFVRFHRKHPEAIERFLWSQFIWKQWPIIGVSQISRSEWRAFFSRVFHMQAQRLPASRGSLVVTMIYVSRLLFVIDILSQIVCTVNGFANEEILWIINADSVEARFIKITVRVYNK
jgi:hypothetical protein